MNILAIESSCDETAAAVVKDGREILTCVIASQAELHSVYGGVVPEIAARNHIKVISQVTRQALQEAGLTLQEVDGVGVTFAPGLIGALLVGVNFAKGLCAASGKPLIPVHHLRAHIAANYLAYPDLAPPFLCLIASGGHSHIVLVKDYTEFEILGRTRDDAAGEAFDKVARVLGLSYPGGVAVDRLAREGNREAIPFPQVNFSDAPYDFSFSGVKTSVINLVHKLRQREEELPVADLAASFREAVCSVLVKKLFLAADTLGMKKVAVCGGVAANSRLRELLEEGSHKRGCMLYLPPLSLCGDNAAMVGSCAYFEFLQQNIAKSDLNARPTLGIDYKYSQLD
jgi:N6-L-threonylcarbamoyladenine synthase